MNLRLQKSLSTELDDLLEYIPSSNGERQKLEGILRKSTMSLAEAKAKYPDWYERRIVKGERRGRWTVKRDLYDWWLRRIRDEIRVGHRYHGIMTLAVYAKKCGIEEGCMPTVSLSTTRSVSVSIFITLFW